MFLWKSFPKFCIRLFIKCHCVFMENVTNIGAIVYLMTPIMIIYCFKHNTLSPHCNLFLLRRYSVTNISCKLSVFDTGHNHRTIGCLLQFRLLSSNAVHYK